MEKIDLAEPIDVVYLWVDGSTKEFKRSLAQAKQNTNTPLTSTNSAPHRFRNYGELRYSLRSIEKYAPWIRNIYIVTNGQVPAWLNAAHPQIHLVSHQDIFPDPHCLPTFNSNAIDLQLRHIPGLSPRFIYMNDDVFLGSPLYRYDLLDSNGQQILYFDPFPIDPPQNGTSVGDVANHRTLKLVTSRWGEIEHNLLPAHMPRLYDQAILHALENDFAAEYQKTSSNQFRSEDDVALSVLYFGYAANAWPQKDKPKTILLNWHTPTSFFEMLTPNLRLMLYRFYEILKMRPKSFCLNDDLDQSLTSKMVQVSLSVFLKLYFPTRSAYERRWPR